MENRVPQGGVANAGEPEEEIKVISSPHKGYFGDIVLTLQHPGGLKQEIPTPSGDSAFRPFLIDYILKDTFGDGQTENEVRAIKATREYCVKWFQGLIEIGELVRPVTVDDIHDLAGPFHDGYLAALTGNVRVL